MELQNEIWRPIEGFPDYEVSDMGRVRSLKYGKIKTLRPGVNSKGYCIVVLSIGGVAKCKSVHRLVASAFLGASDLYIDHIDMVKTNNLLSNLRYCTHRENDTYRSLSSKTSSIYTGVSWHKKSGKWQSSIRVHQKSLCLGFFDDERTASQAYQNALKTHNAGGKVLSIREQKKEDKLHLDYAEYTTKEYNKELDLR